jgi:hypothetical protein
VEKVQKCEKSAKSAMQMQNAMWKSAMRWALTKSANKNAMQKSFCTAIPAEYWRISMGDFPVHWAALSIVDRRFTYFKGWRRYPESSVCKDLSIGPLIA